MRPAYPGLLTNLWLGAWRKAKSESMSNVTFDIKGFGISRKTP
jgi:hypothetical protein